jgi:cation transport ATPase
MKKIELKTSGMTCASCGTTVEKSLLNLNAVSKVQVNLGTETATVEIKPKNVKLKDLEIAVNDAGYEVIKLQESGEIVGFMDDGINDAPAFAQAGVDIAIGSGTDVVIESGELVLIKDVLIDAISAVQLSKKVIDRIKQSVFWAFAYNTALISIAAVKIKKNSNLDSKVFDLEQKLDMNDSDIISNPSIHDI